MLDLREELQRIASGALGALDHAAWWISWQTRPTPCANALDVDALAAQDEGSLSGPQAETSA
jgi:hypothetical protein